MITEQKSSNSRAIHFCIITAITPWRFSCNVQHDEQKSLVVFPIQSLLTDCEPNHKTVQINNWKQKSMRKKEKKEKKC